MKIELKTPYESLNPFDAEIPNLTIVTGLNGTGKTHLLEGVSKNSIEVSENEKELKLRKYIPHNLLNPNPPNIWKKNSGNGNLVNLWVEFEVYRRTGLTINHEEFRKENLAVVESVAKFAEKSLEELDREDFNKYFLFDQNVTVGDIFSQSYSTLFKRYHDKSEKNLHNEFSNQVKNRKEIKFFTQDEFISVFGNPPWEEVNQILQAANLDFEVNCPSHLDENENFTVRLIKKSIKKEIPFERLSSGEKILLSLAFALYNSKLSYQFPDILLLDEPDATLHPSMTKQLLNVIEEFFVIEKGVKVIMTTHSPSTVALAPEESLFVMNKTEPRLEKTTKDKALRILTEGVPSLSINYENRRQVFVESENDVAFFDKFYEKLKNRLTPEISLNFISSGESRTDKNGQPISNCGQVEKITETLSKAGNKFIFGIIDWDYKNNDNNHVKVLGKNRRHSIENYIFDPILLAAFLFREKFITRQDLKLNDDETYTDFKNLSVEQLQIISDFITDKVAPLTNSADTELNVVRYLLGIQIEVPRWYLIHHGHNLEKFLIDAFPRLQNFTKREGDLKKEIINKVVDDIPEFIPLDILEVLHSIQTT